MSNAPLSMLLLEKLGQDVTAEHTDKHGRVSSYDRTIRDVDLAPNTQAEINYWYDTDGANTVNASSDVDSADCKEMVQAIKDRRLIFHNARDFSDLNFHNKITLVGGEAGGAPGLTSTYNTNSSIFKDATRRYMVNPDGTVISWDRKRPVA